MSLQPTLKKMYDQLQTGQKVFIKLKYPASKAGSIIEVTSVTKSQYNYYHLATALWKGKPHQNRLYDLHGDKPYEFLPDYMGEPVYQINKLEKKPIISIDQVDLTGEKATVGNIIVYKHTHRRSSDLRIGRIESFSPKSMKVKPISGPKIASWRSKDYHTVSKDFLIISPDTIDNITLMVLKHG